MRISNFGPVPPLPNADTEALCQRVVEQYATNKFAAHKMYRDFCADNKPGKWEAIAMLDRIQWLIYEAGLGR
jgi:hypothetical protein